MNYELSTPQTEFTGWQRVLREVENAGVTAALMAMMLLPVAEAVLRKTTRVGVTGATVIVQHLTLIVGMLGGAIAARDGRLLALSALSAILHGRVKTVATIFSRSFEMAVSAFL
jgi:C4-dicarboxylate transporter DctM subunit